MSRYLLLVLLNLPLVIIGITSAVVAYKLQKIGKRRFVFRVVLWLGILIALILVEPIYNYLFSNNLTQTEPLSLFDVIQLTAIIVVLFIANLANNKVTNLEKRVQDLHQELSIRTSTKKPKVSKKL